MRGHAGTRRREGKQTQFALRSQAAFARKVQTYGGRRQWVEEAGGKYLSFPHISTDTRRRVVLRVIPFYLFLYTLYLLVQIKKKNEKDVKNSEFEAELR